MTPDVSLEFIIITYAASVFVNQVLDCAGEQSLGTQVLLGWLDGVRGDEWAYSEKSVNDHVTNRAIVSARGHSTTGSTFPLTHTMVELQHRHGDVTMIESTLSDECAARTDLHVWKHVISDESDDNDQDCEFEDDDSSTDSSTDCSMEDESSFDDTSSFDEEEEIEDSNDCVSLQLRNASEATSKPVFVSLAMADKLQLSQSARDLFARPVSKMPMERTSSFYVQNPNPKIEESTTGIIYAIQTESPMAAVAPSCITMDRGDSVQSPKHVLRCILNQHNQQLTFIPYDSVSTWVSGDVASYTASLLAAVRRHDLDAIRAHRAVAGPHSLQCANRFAESLLHTVARHGQVEILRYLVEEANVSLHVCCDQGRTILHDAAWSTAPNFDCIRYILSRHPELLYVTDKRQYCPLDYAPRCSWEAWRSFLTQNVDLLSLPPPPPLEPPPAMDTSEVLLTSVSRWFSSIYP
jgi:Ankyrin repeats (3 copies)